MQLNNPIFINQTDADIRYINTTGDTVNGNLTSNQNVIANNLVYNTGNQNISGNKIFRNTIYANELLITRPNFIYDTLKTGRITILSGIGPFERRVYSGNLGVLNNPNETVVMFSFTGNPTNDRSQFLSRFLMTNITTFGGSSPTTEGSHIEPLHAGAVGGGTVTNYNSRDARVANVVVVNHPVNNIIGRTSNAELLFVSKDYLQTSSNTYLSTFNTFFSGAGVLTTTTTSFPSTPTFPTGFSYIDRQNQFGVGFIMGFYAGPFTSRVNPFGVQSANDSVNNETGCSIMFESAWLSDGPNNESWLNMAFRNYGPSGINRVGGIANPTGLTLNVYAID